MDGSGSGFAHFDTPIGRCGIAWGSLGIRAIWLPGRLPSRPTAPPPPAVRAAIDDMVALLGGERRDLSGIALDMTDVPDFHRRVYKIARTIPAGATISYGDIARRLGTVSAARAVGQALGRNPFPIVVPCHRVLAAGGRIGGFSADGGVATKRRMLAIESGGAS